MLRRDFLSGISLAMGGVVAGRVATAQQAAKSILDYGANPNGKSLSTKAIQRAIDEISRAGGGVVHAPSGIFLVGGLELKSRVTLYLDAGCTLLGSTSIDDYESRRGSGGYHLLFAQNAENVTLSGPGTIDGQGPAFWESANRPPAPPENVWKDVATHYVQVKKGGHRPSPMIEFAQCRNVSVNGVTLKNSAGWTLRSAACETVSIDGIRIRNPYFGINTDGIDIAASRDVQVSNCDIVTGDDAIVLKSANPYGESLPTKNIKITNCKMSTSCNGFKIGTETQGVFENIVFSNSVIYSDASAPLNARVIGGISIEMVDGGSVDGVTVSNIHMQNVRTPIFVRLEARKQGDSSFLRNVSIDGVEASGAIVTSSISGVSGLRPSDITVSNSHFRTLEQGQKDWVHRDIPEVADKYPEAWMMGRLPAYGFYVRHADRVRLRNVAFATDKPDARPAIVCDDVNDVTLDGLELAAPVEGAPLIDLRNTSRASLTGMRSPAGVRVFAEISGANSSEITLHGNTLGGGEQAVAYTNGATEGSARVD
jgi:polygalacturonase